MTSFDDLALAAPLARALRDEGHTAPTPIQAQAIPPGMAGRDVLGIAQTGTGKTAAFVLPILHRLCGDERKAGRGCARALVLAPTRELAVQIEERVRAYGGNMRPRTALVIGGVPHGRQRKALSRGVEVLVATPGRLSEMAEAGDADLSRTEVLVLDEADQMLDMGFIHAVRRLRKMMPQRVQTYLFSATMPKEIQAFADDLLTDPVRVAVTPVAKTADRVEQSVLFVSKGEKGTALARLLTDPEVDRALVFARTKHGADKVVRGLEKAGIDAAAIHGNKSQNARQRALRGFAEGTTPVLVATDIAARGIDVTGISHVIQHDLPEVPETYVHRIGRTARAGADGVAVALCCGEEVSLLRAVERLTKQAVPVMDGSDEAEMIAVKAPPKQRGGRGAGGGGRRQGAPRAAAKADPAKKPRRRRGPPRGQGRGGKQAAAGGAR